MTKRKTLQEFIVQARKKFGNKFDYSKAVYVNTHTPLCIICPEHGEFMQAPIGHLKSHGCPKCGQLIGAAKNGKKRIIYDSYETCKYYASLCKGRYDFQKKYRKAWKRSRDNGWLNTFFPINMKDKNARIHCVYIFFFPKNNAVYVGRTNDPKVREKQHNSDMHSSVHKFSVDNNETIPKMEIKFSDLSVDESLKIESELIQKYRNNGYKIINIQPTGIGVGSIGALSHGKLTYNYCYNVAKKYDNFTLFCEENKSVYNKTRKKGWINDYTWLKRKKMPNDYWTYERCYEEAKKYKTRNGLQKYCKGCYLKALRNGWLEDYYWLDKPKVQFKVKNGYWTYKTCLNAAKQCSSRSDFRRKFKTAYCKSLQMDWIKEFFPNKESQTKVTAINISTNEISTFESIFECAKTLNIPHNAISNVICGYQKTTHGYIFKHVA